MKSRYSILLGFFGLILCGAGLFSLPCATPRGMPGLPFYDALFTATSAVCITGLTVIDPGSQLSPFGLWTLLVLVQIGCVGIMTFGTFVLVCTGRRVSLANEFSLSNAYGVKGVNGFRGLILWVVLSLLAFEALGAAGLHAFTGESWERSFFFSTMAFCNAGFSLAPDSLAAFARSPGALVTFATLVVLGGFGFLVLYNLFTIRFWKRNLVARGRPSLHARIVVWTSVVFIVLMFAFLLVYEWNGVLASFESWTDRCAVAFFQSVTPRTCGFTVVPVESFRDASRFLMQILMFIGAGPGGAGGGVKVTTLVVVLAVVASICRGSRDVTLSHRTVGEDVVREAILIFFLYALLVAVAMTLLLITEPDETPFESMLFESVSAVSTTGLSLGDTTRQLSTAGRAVIMTCMFIGRLGALTVVLLVAGKESPQTIRYPREDIAVG